MAQKNGRRTPPPNPHAMPQSLRESAQHIWMAGLSAFAKAQAGGNKVFEALMKEGEALQSRTRQAARDQVDEMAEKASGTWDKLEQVFETRVAKALHTLGVPTHDDIETLSRRVAELSALVDSLQRTPKAAPPLAKASASKRTAKATAPKAASKTARTSIALQKAAKKSAPKRGMTQTPSTTRPTTRAPAKAATASRPAKTQQSSRAKAAD